MDEILSVPPPAGDAGIVWTTPNGWRVWEQLGPSTHRGMADGAVSKASWCDAPDTVVWHRPTIPRRSGSSEAQGLMRIVSTPIGGGSTAVRIRLRPPSGERAWLPPTPWGAVRPRWCVAGTKPKRGRQAGEGGERRSPSSPHGRWPQRWRQALDGSHGAGSAVSGIQRLNCTM